MKINRLFSILTMIINKERITAKELSEYFQVSIRTIQRDIDTLSVLSMLRLEKKVDINYLTTIK